MKNNTAHSDAYKVHYPNMPVYEQEAVVKGITLRQFLGDYAGVEDDIAEELIAGWSTADQSAEEINLEHKDSDSNSGIRWNMVLRYIGTFGMLGIQLLLAFNLQYIDTNILDSLYYKSMGFYFTAVLIGGMNIVLLLGKQSGDRKFIITGRVVGLLGFVVYVYLAIYIINKIFD